MPIDVLRDCGIGQGVRGTDTRRQCPHCFDLFKCSS
jgi:hypothetical protein